ncbi:TRAP transporter fused permease subunit [Sneathiella marina]|uniref:TRAP transporter fused permease subunit n=1 Tax=Sneathiella marina TaxID=2950108 RepID=A0ABY4W650_9PROT|nr:TRAP transporter fused permease subunit [Sneathiella marina]USG62497.1 TRAP transporter fused permease subunit [Sneathiella marina]
MTSSLKSTLNWFSAIVGAVIALQAIYVAMAGGWDITLSRSWILCGAVIVALLNNLLADKRLKSGDLPSGPFKVALWAFDLLLIVIFVIATLKFIEIMRLIEETLFEYETADIAIAFAGVLVLLETTRRLFGLPIVIIAALGILYCLYGEYLPGFLNHSGFSLNRSMQTIWYSFQGVYGLPMGVVLQVVLIFVVFGVVLEGSGASDALIRASVALTGRTRGGPAHSAVVASAVFGSMSGSVTANVVGTGSFTIPMIKRRGFPAATAGGIEAAASTGGQIVPPVMGAAAFLMADLTGSAYTTICIAALIPALFYYGSLFASISIQAGASGIEPIPKSERPPLNKQDLVACLLFVIPILTIVFVLVMGRSPALAGFWAIVAAVILGGFNKRNRENPRVIWEVLKKAGRACAWIIVAVGCIGVILGVLNLTGLGLAFASVVAEFSEYSLFAALLTTALAALVLGMGMPTLPAYLIIILVLGPVMQKLGAELIPTHMFVFYFGVLSAITPPVAIGAFAAAPIAGAHPFSTAIAAVRLAIVGFIIPFIFVYEPSLLLVGSFDLESFVRVSVSLAFAIWLINTAMIGYEGGNLGSIERSLRALVGVGLLIQVPALQMGLLVIGILIVIQRRMQARRKDTQKL